MREDPQGRARRFMAGLTDFDRFTRFSGRGDQGSSCLSRRYDQRLCSLGIASDISVRDGNAYMGTTENAVPGAPGRDIAFCVS